MMYLYLINNNVVENVIAVEDPEAFMANASAYLATFDDIVLKDREQEAGDPGIGDQYDAATEVFSAPRDRQHVDASVTRRDLNEADLEEKRFWMTAEGLQQARKVDDDAWLVRVPNEQSLLLRTGALRTRIQAEAMGETRVQRQLRNINLARNQELRRLHREARRARRG